jgi:hypothetical protein
MSVRIALLISLPVLASLTGGAPVEAQSGACQLGARVIDRQDRTGVVVEAKGSDCRVKHEDGTVHYYLAWMLKPAAQPDGKAEASDTHGPLRPGTYLCTAANGAAGKFRLVIRSGTEYVSSSGKTGSYTLNPADGTFVIGSGPWANYRGAKLGPTKFGLTERPGKFYATVCDLQ